MAANQPNEEPRRDKPVAAESNPLRRPSATTSRLKPESEMSEGLNHEAEVKPASFEYDPTKRRTPQTGQGQGGYG